MLKNLTLAALAMISMSAFAQSTSQDVSRTMSEPAKSRNDDWSIHNGDHFQMRKWLEKRATWSLSGGDRYYLAAMLDRLPTNLEHSLVAGLSNAHRQAVMINDEMLAQRFPADTTVVTTSTSSTDIAGNTATTTTTTVTSSDAMANNMSWASERSSRPMRMIMSSSAKPKDISYDQAIDILTGDLNDASTAMLRDWWNGTASDRDRDVIVRLLKDDASLADQIYYPSVYSRRTVSWTNWDSNR